MNANAEVTAQRIVEMIERHQADISNVFGCQYRMSLRDRIDTVKNGLDNVCDVSDASPRPWDAPGGPDWVKRGTSIQELGRDIYELMLAAIPHDAGDAESFMLDLLWDLEANHGFPGMYNEQRPYLS